MTINTAATYTATIKTTTGTFTIALDAKAAPVTVNSFVFLAGKGYFHCNIFHRVIPGFVDQTGDPTGTGTGGPGYEFADENIPKAYATGDVAMANSGGTATNGSQFFMVAPGGASALDSTSPVGGTHCSARSHPARPWSTPSTTRDPAAAPPGGPAHALCHHSHS